MRMVRHNSTRRFLPAVESLEARWCPSVSIGVRGQVLFIRGDAAANTVAIQDDGSGNVTANIDGKSVSGSNIHRIYVDTHGGGDTINYSLTNPLQTREFLGIETGAGNDTITLDFSQGVAAGGRLGVGVQTGGGDDNVSATLGSIAAKASASVNIETGDGNSTVNFGFTGALNGSLSTRLESGDGNNTVTNNYTVDAGSTGRLRTKVEVGDGNNNLTMNILGDGVSTLKALYAKLEACSGMNTIVNTPNVVVDMGD
jgi:hypothetical protein